MRIIVESSAKVLYDRIAPLVDEMLASSRAGVGDLCQTEAAIGAALAGLRSVLVEAALEATSQSAPSLWACPTCKSKLAAWGSRSKAVVTCHGEGCLSIMRYRCRDCGEDFYPLQTVNDLCGKQFTIGARELIAAEAADAAFSPASSRLMRMGVPVSPSEVERISDQAGQMRKDEEELARVHLVKRGRDLPIALYPWSDWEPHAKAAENAVMSVDGAKIRSDKAGPAGLEWFEVRSAVLTLPGPGMPRAQIAGDISPDALFEGMRCIWRQSPVGKLPLVFVADGAEWIWDRVGCYFPRAVQILDVYHAAQHVASAAKAAWGDQDPKAREWVEGAVGMLIELGPKAIVRELVGALREGGVVDPDELVRNIRYLLRHRHRMQYAKWRDQGLTIGSGAMESRIKQVSTMRLRRPGMMWTRKGADLMLRLRAATLSGGINITFQRHRKICAERVNKYRLAA